MNYNEKEIISALVADIKETKTEEITKAKTINRPRRRLGRRFGAINYMSGSSFRTPFSLRFPS